MTKGKLVKVLVLWSAVIVGLLISAGGVVIVRRGFSARDHPSVLETYIAKTARKLSVPASQRNATNPFAPTPEVLREARAHFADHCAICHGNDGSGKTQIGQNLYPKAPDMRLPDTQKLTDGEIFYIIHNGIRLDEGGCGRLRFAGYAVLSRRPGVGKCRMIPCAKNGGRSRAWAKNSDWQC